MSSKVWTLREGGNQLYGAGGKQGQKGSQKEKRWNPWPMSPYKYIGPILQKVYLVQHALISSM